MKIRAFDLTFYSFIPTGSSLACACAGHWLPAIYLILVAILLLLVDAAFAKP